MLLRLALSFHYSLSFEQSFPSGDVSIRAAGGSPGIHPAKCGVLSQEWVTITFCTEAS